VLFPMGYFTGDRRGDPISAAHWRAAAVIGTLLLFAGNGGVTFAEQHVASGVVALLVGTVPLWMAIFAHLGRIQRLSPVGLVGLVAGFAGVALLLRTGGGGTAAPGYYAIALAAPLCWAAGSIYGRGAVAPRRPLLGVAMEMLCGGAALCVVAAALGEWGQVHLASISALSLGGMAYLVVFGSLIAYTAYVYLLRTVTPRAVSSYAYVNPLVAVLLGWAFASESVTLGTLLAAALIVVAVAVLLASDRRSAVKPEQQAAALAGRSPEGAALEREQEEASA